MAIPVFDPRILTIAARRRPWDGVTGAQDRNSGSTSPGLDSSRDRILSRAWAETRVFSSKWIISRRKAPRAIDCSPESRKANDQIRENPPTSGDGMVMT